MTRSVRPQSKEELTLVRNREILYPKTDEDALKLSELKVPTKFVYYDFLPLFRVLVHTRGIQLKTESFVDLEQKALSNLERRWQFDFERTKDGIVLKCPRTKKNHETMNSVYRALAKFYGNHGMKVKYVIKRHASSVKVVFTFLRDANVFATQDERA